MNFCCRLYLVVATLFSLGIPVFSADSTVSSATLLPTPAAAVAAITLIADSGLPGKTESFRVLQRKYLKTVMVTNLLYAAGFALNRGVVIPRMREAEGATESMKLLPLNFLSGAMMYASLPMSAVTSYKARNNYRRYYKESPRNFTMPLLFGGVALAIGAAGTSYFQMYKDYRDNNEIDNSYQKYSGLMWGLLDAGNITWAGANLYSLAYIVALGRMAEKKSPPRVSLQVAPLRIRDANGLVMLCDF